MDGIKLKGRSPLVVDIPMLKKQYCAVLHVQKRPGTTKRIRTLLDGVLNFFDDLVTASEDGRISLKLDPVPDDAGMEMKGTKDANHGGGEKAD
ncbi:MAG: hypothetical protein WAX69_22295 [Victivallales bacterium]